MADVVARLPEEFREQAGTLEAYAPAAAAAFREAAQRVERALQDAASEPLKLPDAARASGYSTDHLSRLIAQGKLRNVGRKHAPLVLRGDLPAKPRATAAPMRLAVGDDVAPVDPSVMRRARLARGRR